MTTAKTDPDLTFNFATNKLSATGFVGALEGNADTATTAGNLSFGSANQVVFKNSSNNGATSSNLTFNGTLLFGNQVRANNITLGVTNGTTINTLSGDLNLDSANDKVDIQARLDVDGLVELKSANPSGTLASDNAAVKITNSLGVGGKIFAGDDIIAFNSSDRNLKENIVVIPNALDKVNSLTGNTFNWKSGSNATTPEFYSGISEDTGVIAQEVEALGLPGITTTRDDGTKAVRYERLIPVLIQAVKELSAKVTALESS